MERQYRQGDLLLEEVEIIPGEAEVVESNVVVYGEATGHAHKLGAGGKVLRTAEKTYIEIRFAPTPLTHEEHKTILLPPGSYEVIRQREYQPYERAIRDVQD